MRERTLSACLRALRASGGFGLVLARALSVAAVAALPAAGCGGGADPTAPPDPGGQSLDEPVALDLMSPEDRYKGFPGGLVDNGTPTVTPTRGRLVIISISMSNGQQEFARFIGLFAGDAAVDPAIGLVNCARGGNALENWLQKQSLWDDCKTKVLNAGFDLDQIKVVWAKDADQFTSQSTTLPDPDADYFHLVDNISALSQRIGQEFPSVQAIFHTSRIYGGYVAQPNQRARGEPISYEGGLAINEVIRRQQRGELPRAPWVGWGPYLWADGTTPNGSGLFWVPADFEGTGGDNPHPSLAGETKVAGALQSFFLRFDWYAR
ncbi:MAG: hypothetical protein ACE5HQ_12310 [Gemmatimonadota bacterium]